MQVAITGASGLLGSALVPALRADGHQVVRFVRGPANEPDARSWDPARRHLAPADLADVDAVVHLAGAGVADRRWTRSHRDAIRRSRVDGTTTVAQAIAASGRPVALLSASAIGWYGDTGDRATDESGPPGKGFLAQVCRDWEAATEAAGVRTVLLRTGVVLSGRGGALPKQARVARLGLGAPLGSGRQWISWISMADQLAAIRHLLTADIRGPVNLVSPSPVTNAEFARTLNAVLHRPTFPVSVPPFVLRAALGAFADEGVLTGQRLMPGVLERDGFSFAHRDLASALRAALSPPPDPS